MAKQKKKPLASKPTPAPNPKKKSATVGKRYWTRRFYIPGFGFVDTGDEASKEALAAWSETSKVDVSAYLSKEERKVREQPLTDKEKLAAYEALKKE